jgi:iron complex outermembrane recepter protein
MSPKIPTHRRSIFRLTAVTQILAVCSTILAAGPSLAQQAPSQATAPSEATLEEIVVTAQKREQYAKDVPIAMTVFSGATIEQAGFTDLGDYSKFVPGMIYNGSSLGERSGPDIVIRGIANSRLFDFETNIGTNTTGFAYGEVQAYAFNPELIDVQRIEVLKGPQGTLYGASAMGGLVKVVPNLPQFNEFSATIQGGTSALNSGWNANGLGWKFATVVNAPLSDVLAVRFDFHSSSDPGFINIHLLSGNPNEQYGANGLVGFNSLQSNVYGAGEFLKNVNPTTDGGGRFAVRFKPNEQFDATLAFLYDSRQTDSLPNYEPALQTSQSPLTADQFQLQPSSTNYSLASLEASYDFGPAILHSITGWIERTHADSVDFAGITYGALGGNGTVPLPTPAPVTFSVNTRVLSQELRLQGNEKDLLWTGSALDWTVGGFYQREQRDALGGVTVGANWLTGAIPPLTPPPSGTETVWDGQYISTYTNKAEFADVTFHFTPKLSLSGGVRHSSQNVDATRTDFSDIFASAPPMGNATIQEPASETKTTPRATLEFAPTDQINLYAAYSEGFRIGGHNPIGNLSTPGCAAALQKFGLTNPAGAAEFQSDSIKNYEVGIKSAFERVTANLTVFREDWTDLQTTINLDQYDNACGASFVGNAGTARITGAEWEVHALVIDQLQVALSGQYADAKIQSVVQGSSGTVGAPLESAPKWQVTSGLIYTIQPRAEWKSTARIDYAYVGQRNFSNTNTPVDPRYQLPGYGEINLRFSADHDNWIYTTYVSNLTNAIPQLGVEILSGGPGNYSGAYAPGSQRFVTTSAPRTLGVQIQKSF